MKNRRKTRFVHSHIELAVAAMVLVALLMLIPTKAMANWNFDPSCSAEKITAIEDPDPPNVFMMLDRSGSMGSLRDDSGNQTLWQVAVNSIKNVVQAQEQFVRFGLGYFYSSTATESVVSDDNNYDEIKESLDGESPWGVTPTDRAFNQIASSQSMNEAGRSSGGVMITDGQPCCTSSSVQDAIDAACDLRDDHLVYVAGLGGATDQELNHKLAAAAGTGSCTAGDPCGPGNVPKSSCEGAFHANNQTEFQNIINEISDTLQCTFPVDTSLHVTEEAPDDPGATRVEIQTAEGWLRIDHRDHSADGHGWYYPSQESNTQVTLTSEYCNMIQEGDVYHVKTQLACDCTTQEGDPCTLSNPDPGECPDGIYGCQDGYLFCEPLPIWECPTGCDAHFNNDLCHVGNFDYDLEDLADGDIDYVADAEDARNRCHIGRIRCEPVSGYEVDQPVCYQALSPMPELCDGMDNSCSGSIDDIGPSWTSWYSGGDTFAGTAWDGVSLDDLEDEGILEEHWQSPSCQERSMCSCEGPNLQGPRNEHVGMHNEDGYEDIIQEFEDYLAGWSAEYCQCSSELQR